MQYGLKRFSHNTVNYLIEMFQLLDYPRSQVLLLFLQLLSLFLFFQLLLLWSLLWNLLIYCCGSNYYAFAIEIEIILIEGKVCRLLRLLFIFLYFLRSNLLRVNCFGSLCFFLKVSNDLNLRFFLLYLFLLFLR